MSLIISRREERNAQYNVKTPFHACGSICTHIRQISPNGPLGEFHFPFFKSALIEVDTSISCVFLRRVTDVVTLVKLCSSDHGQGCCFFGAARQGRRAARRQGRRGGLVRHGFWARSVLGEGQYMTNRIVSAAQPSTEIGSHIAVEFAAPLD